MKLQRNEKFNQIIIEILGDKGLSLSNPESDLFFEFYKKGFLIGHEECTNLKETKKERLIERAFLIENNTFEEKISEATHYSYLDDQIYDCHHILTDIIVFLEEHNHPKVKKIKEIIKNLDSRYSDE